MTGQSGDSGLERLGLLIRNATTQAEKSVSKDQLSIMDHFRHERFRPVSCVSSSTLPQPWRRFLTLHLLG